MSLPVLDATFQCTVMLTLAKDTPAVMANPSTDLLVAAAVRNRTFTLPPWFTDHPSHSPPYIYEAGMETMHIIRHYQLLLNINDGEIILFIITHTQTSRILTKFILTLKLIFNYCIEFIQLWSAEIGQHFTHAREHSLITDYVCNRYGNPQTK